MDLASKLFKGDRVIWVIFMFLCLVSVIEVFSATSTIAYKNANHWAPIVRHATFLLGGFVLVLLMHNIPCRFYSLLSLLLPVSMVLLAITPFVGVVVNGEPSLAGNSRNPFPALGNSQDSRYRLYGVYPEQAELVHG